MNKYSIILPVKNGGEYVKECINGILSQTYAEFHLHILDNSSTDGTTEWMESLKDERIILTLSEKSLSIEENWGRIVSIPKNQFMTLIGHDDILYPHYLQEVDQLIEKHPEASLYQTHYNFVNRKGSILRPCLPMDEVQQGHEFLACHMARTMDSMGTGYVMRSKDYDALGGIPIHYPNLIFADYQLWVQLSSITYKVTCLKECFDYRIHENTSKKASGIDYIKAFEQYVYFLNTLKVDSHFSEVIIRYGNDFLIYYCQALAHRLLKMPKSKRNLTVKQYIEKCKEYAMLLIPEQNFDPLSKPLVKVAEQLDNNLIGRQLFSLYQKIKRK